LLQTAVLGGRKVNTQVLGVGRTKRQSMSAAARQAVELLHWHGDLSDHLVPLFEKPATKERRADGTVIYQVSGEGGGLLLWSLRGLVVS
jgi:hypothetical protein